MLTLVQQERRAFRDRLQHSTSRWCTATFVACEYYKATAWSVRWSRRSSENAVPHPHTAAAESWSRWWDSLIFSHRLGVRDMAKLGQVVRSIVVWAPCTAMGSVLCFPVDDASWSTTLSLPPKGQARSSVQWYGSFPPYDHTALTPFTATLFGWWRQRFIRKAFSWFLGECVVQWSSNRAKEKLRKNASFPTGQRQVPKGK
jgi:hypothetical protein